MFTAGNTAICAPTLIMAYTDQWITDLLNTPLPVGLTCEAEYRISCFANHINSELQKCVNHMLPDVVQSNTPLQSIPHQRHHLEKLGRRHWALCLSAMQDTSSKCIIHRFEDYQRHISNVTCKTHKIVIQLPWLPLQTAQGDAVPFPI